MKLIVGLTGLYCAGKNEAAAVFEEAGFFVIDVDQVGHEILEVQKEEVVRQFGDRILTPEGRVDRKRLGQIVFRNPDQLRLLESILHPLMVKQVEEIVAREQRHTVINAALLFKMGLDSLCNRIVIIKAPLLERINRSMDRDGLNVFSALARILSQRKLIPQSSLSRADTVIVKNRGTRGELRETLQTLIRQWTK